MDKRQAAMQAAQQELLRERRAQLGGVPDRTQDILVIQVRQHLAVGSCTCCICFALLPWERRRAASCGGVIA